MYKRVLIVVDARPVSAVATAEGLALANAHGAEVYFFTVMPSFPLLMADTPVYAVSAEQDFNQAAESNAKRLLDAASAAATLEGVRCEVGQGSGDDAARLISQAADAQACDLIVVASEGRNALIRMLTGSVIPGLITVSHLPVLICKDKTAHLAAEAPGNE